MSNLNQSQAQDMEQLIAEIKNQPQPSQIIRCIPECPPRLTEPITTIRYEGEYPSLGITWFIEFEAQGICDTCLTVLRNSNWVFFDPRFPPFNAITTPAVPITTIPLVGCDFNIIFKEYCRADPIGARPPHCLCNAIEGLTNCRLAVTRWGVNIPPTVRCDTPTIIVRYYRIPNTPCGGVIALICQGDQTRPPPAQCPQPIGGVLTCYCCRYNANRLEGIFNTKEDYEVLKGLTLGTEAWETDVDVNILRKLKHII